ncbi:MAG: ABC transporter ATP-binding protein [Sciscionella sp.]
MTMTDAASQTTTTVDKVRVTGVCKRFSRVEHGKTEIVDALEDVSMVVRPGEIVVLTGQSGCGKTTLLRILMGLDKATAGTVTVDDKRITGPGPDRAMVFQHAELLPWRSAIGNVEFGLETTGVHSKKERRAIARQYIELVGLGDAARRNPYELSGGMRQRVSLARAMAIQPEVLLMDEPFGALDAQTRETLQQEVLSLQLEQHQTIVFVTHDLDEAVLLADRVVMLAPSPGRVHTVVDVNLPRPRHKIEDIRTSDAFMELRALLWRELQAANKTATPVAEIEKR